MLLNHVALMILYEADMPWIRLSSDDQPLRACPVPVHLTLACLQVKAYLLNPTITSARLAALTRNLHGEEEEKSWCLVKLPHLYLFYRTNGQTFDSLQPIRAHSKYTGAKDRSTSLSIICFDAELKSMLATPFVVLAMQVCCYTHWLGLPHSDGKEPVLRLRSFLHLKNMNRLQTQGSM
ncbi:hypothetical protein DM02DRAFT_327095 [Periconia macrospinosa]|uniref:Uncharacterized protein n=1 Tax=Periconia macrospinosa TaxID=97972 RepID=A0A2V1EA95_9PLEO|nr:hypothetical protein DM02DRAFT_327095 [Periconia macrospinosa]